MDGRSELQYQRNRLFAPSMKVWQQRFLERLTRKGLLPPSSVFRPSGYKPPRMRATAKEIKVAISAITGGRAVGADTLHEQVQKRLPHRHVRRDDVRRLNPKASPGRPKQ
jgi:Mg-chelatase subunit ChlI